MEIFTVDREEYTTSSELITGFDKVSWIERYNKPSEFTLVGNPHPLLEMLPLGSFITHARTGMVMEVETHVIEENEDGIPRLTISGRDVLTVIMENRFLDLRNPDEDAWVDLNALYSFPEHSYGTTRDIVWELNNPTKSWDQVRALIYRYLDWPNSGSDYLVANQLNLPNIVVGGLAGGTENKPRNRYYKNFTSLATVIYDILQTADIGIRVSRSSFGGGSPGLIDFTIHRGADLSTSVRFENLISARYLWSNVNNKNGFYGGIPGYAIRQMNETATGWDVRLTSFFDADFDISALDPDLIGDEQYYTYLRHKGESKMLKKSRGTIIEATAGKSSTHTYNGDYRMGDRVFVQGNYEIGTIMRLVEHAINMDGHVEENVQAFAPIYYGL